MAVGPAVSPEHLAGSRDIAREVFCIVDLLKSGMVKKSSDALADTGWQLAIFT